MRAPLLWLLVASCAAGQQKIFIGAAACGGCHPFEFDQQSKSAHARSLYRAVEHPLAASFATGAVVHRGANLRFEFLRAGSELLVKADDGRYVTQLPLEWAFGAGEQAVTFISRVSPEFHLERSFSYYDGIPSGAFTTNRLFWRGAVAS